MRRAISIAVVFLLAGCTAGYRPAQDKSSLARSTLAAPERAFLMDMAQSMHQRVALAELAGKRTNQPRLRKVAGSLAKSSKKLEQRFKKAMTANELQLPSELQPATVQKLSALRALSGVDLSKQFIGNQTQSLLRDIGRCETEARQGQNPTTRALAQNALPALHQQLDQIQQMSGSIALD